MEITTCLQSLLQLDKLKMDTATTGKILKVVEELVGLNGDKKIELDRLIYRIRQMYRQMLDSVKRRRSVTSELDELYRLFHEFSLGEGFRLCSESERQLEMEILWQLLLEKEFTWFLTTYLLPAVDTDQASPPGARVLSEIEKNAVRYTARYVLRKNQKNAQCWLLNLWLESCTLKTLQIMNLQMSGSAWLIVEDFTLQKMWFMICLLV